MGRQSLTNNNKTYDKQRLSFYLILHNFVHTNMIWDEFIIAPCTARCTAGHWNHRSWGHRVFDAASLNESYNHDTKMRNTHVKHGSSLVHIHTQKHRLGTAVTVRLHNHKLDAM